MNTGCRIETGDFVGSAWGSSPEWTPYAQAIADHYANQTPWFHSTVVNLGLGGRQTTVTRPLLYDTLIFGVNANALERFAMYVQITHQETGIPWAVPNVLPFIPFPALSGSFFSQAPITKLPEAFFLPAKHRLKLDWSVRSDINPDPATITLVGVQLTGGKAPERIQMPNGDVIPVGSRLPLFMTMGMGRRSAAGSETFTFPPLSQDVQYLPPIECNVEIHDASLNFGNLAFSGRELLRIKTTVMGVEKDWTPQLTPLTAIFGSEEQVYTALPYTKPYLLPKGKRIQLQMQNNNAATTLTQGLLTFRGVRLCEY